MAKSIGIHFFEFEDMFRCYRDNENLKGPFKYLVAKLHRCYPGAISLPVSQNFFARFFRRRLVADSSRCLTFSLHCNKHKKHFLLTFLLINGLLYGYNMYVVPLFFILEWFACRKMSSTYGRSRATCYTVMLMEKFRQGDSTRFSSVRLGI